MTAPLPFAFPEFDGEPLCAEIGGDDWFPETAAPVAVAKAICRRCECIDECLRWALDRGEEWGVWGGLSQQERRRMAPRERRAPSIQHGTDSGARAHRRRGETACEACQRASRVASADRQAKRAARKAAAA